VDEITGMTKPLQNIDDDHEKMTGIILNSLYNEYKTSSSGANLRTLQQTTRSMQKFEDFESVVNSLWDKKYIQLDNRKNLYSLTQNGITKVESGSKIL